MIEKHLPADRQGITEIKDIWILSLGRLASPGWARHSLGQLRPRSLRHPPPAVAGLLAMTGFGRIRTINKFR
jgi:hypothetical protein